MKKADTPLDKKCALCYNVSVTERVVHKCEVASTPKKCGKNKKKFAKSLDKWYKVCYNKITNKGWRPTKPLERN